MGKRNTDRSKKDYIRKKWKRWKRWKKMNLMKFTTKSNTNIIERWRCLYVSMFYQEGSFKATFISYHIILLLKGKEILIKHWKKEVKTLSKMDQR